MLTAKEKRKVAQIKKDPSMQDFIEGKTNEEILAGYRFVEDGKGLRVYNSEADYRAAMKERTAKKNIDEINEA